MAGDILGQNAASLQYTLTLTSLATSSSRVAGRESTAILNTGNDYIDYLVAGYVKAGTTPTAGQVDLWCYGSLNDTPAYPDVITGTDAAATMTSAPILSASMALIGSIANDTTTGRVYYFRPTGIGQLFGAVPTSHGLFLSHSMVAALDSTSTNHKFWYTPVYARYT